MQQQRSALLHGGYEDAVPHPKREIGNNQQKFKNVAPNCKIARLAHPPTQKLKLQLHQRAQWKQGARPRGA